MTANEAVQRLIEEDRRLVVLKLLHEDGDYSLNERLLRKALKVWGHGCTDTEVRRLLDWLEANLAVRIDREEIWIAVLTRLGAQHVEGDTLIKGVARPGPES
jgi:hypothetical protein